MCVPDMDCMPPQAFNLFSIMVDRLGEEVRPFAPAILGLLPEVWADADGQPLMRIQARPSTPVRLPDWVDGALCTIMCMSRGAAPACA